MAASVLWWLVGSGLVLVSLGLAHDPWHASTLRDWGNDPVCGAERLAVTTEASRCGAGTAVVTIPEDASTDPTVEILTVGSGGRERSAPFEQNALVEIASLSKLLAAVLFQLLVDGGHLHLETALGQILRCPGFPSQPDNVRLHGDNPFARYTEKDLCESLTRISGLPTRGGYYYSNFAYGLLGYLMELHMGVPFEDLVIERVLAPLGMQDTKVTLTELEWQHRVAPGVDPSSGSGPVWRRAPYGIFLGSGAFHSTLQDMARFLAAAMRAERGDTTGPLSGAMRRVLKPLTWDCPCVRDSCEGVRCDAPTPEHSMVTTGGWQSFRSGPARGWYKAGDTAGYSSFLAFLAREGRGAFGFDTCGGCGVSRGNGSAIQRVVKALALGPSLATWMV